MRDRDKFLTEAMGGHFHEYKPYKKEEHGVMLNVFICSCGWAHGWCENSWKVHCSLKNIDFSKPDGFFKLWNFAIEQEWWDEFEANQGLPKHWVPKKLINPEFFANAVYEYLKEKSVA